MTQLWSARPLVRVAVLVAALLGSIWHPAASQDASLELLVTSRETRQPVGGARVRVTGTRVAGETDRTGHLLLTAIPLGPHTVEVILTGHDTARVDLEFTAGAMLQLQVPLAPRPLVLSGIEVTGEKKAVEVARLSRAGFYQRQRLGFGSFLNPAELEQYRLRSGQLSGLLRGMRGLWLQPTDGGGYVAYANRATGAGAKPCLVPVFIDGMRQQMEQETTERLRATALQLPGTTVRERPESAPTNIDRLIPLQDVDAIEVYAGRADTPIQYQVGKVCGAIVIWTRSSHR